MLLRLVLCLLIFITVQTVAIADTIVPLESNFGVLKIKPVYSNNIGKNIPWNITINNEEHFLFETRFHGSEIFETKIEPNKYRMKLSHECYEDINFDIDIETDESVDFDMSGYIKPKTGTLILNAKRKSKLVTEPVFVNDKLVGETPFNDEVPICSKITISEYKTLVNVVPKYNEEVKHTHIIELIVSSVNFSVFFPNATSSRYSYDYSSNSYIEKKYRTSGANFLLGIDYVSPETLFGGGFFIGGGQIGERNSISFSVGEIIFGFETKKIFWLWKYLNIPISLAIGGRFQWTEMDNGVIAAFIDEPKFLHEPEYFFYKERSIKRFNLDIMPAIDLQITTPVGSIYIGYMYRLTSSDDWWFSYRVPGKFYASESSRGTDYYIPEKYNPLRNIKENFFGIPGVLRVGFRFHELFY